MYGASQEFLAGSCFPSDEDIHVAGSDLAGEREELLHRGRGSKKFMQSTCRPLAGAQALQFSFGNARSMSPTKNQTELHHVRGIGDAVVGAVIDGSEHQSSVVLLAQDD